MRRKKNIYKNFIKNGVGYGLALAGYAVRSGSPLGYPVSIAIEPTNVCNLRCPLCASGAGTLQRPKGSMELAAFKSIIDMLPWSVTDLYLWGQGEPFMAPDFLMMVDYASKRGYRTFVSTNGHFLDDVDMIINSGLAFLIVSLDGVDEESYTSYRVGGDFDRVVRGIANISEAKRRNGKGPIIVLQCLMTRKNAGDRDKFISFAGGIGADRVVFKTLQAISFDENKAEGKRQKAEEKHKDDVYHRDDMNLTRYRINDDGVIETDRRWFFKNRCLRLYYSFQIDCKGNVLPCCFDKDSEYIMGNVFVENKAEGRRQKAEEKKYKNDIILKIWNSDRYRSFRNMLNKKGRVLPMCKDCSEGLKRFVI